MHLKAVPNSYHYRHLWYSASVAEYKLSSASNYKISSLHYKGTRSWIHTYNRFRALGLWTSLTFNYLAEHDSEFINYILKLIPNAAYSDGITMLAFNKTVLDLLTKRRQGMKKNKMKWGKKECMSAFRKDLLALEETPFLFQRWRDRRRTGHIFKSN